MYGLRGSSVGTIVRSEGWVCHGLGYRCDRPSAIGGGQDCGHYQRSTGYRLSLGVGGCDIYGCVCSHGRSERALRICWIRKKGRSYTGITAGGLLVDVVEEGERGVDVVLVGVGESVLDGSADEEDILVEDGSDEEGVVLEEVGV